MSDAQQPIIIKRIKKGGHGHHGGAWKVAYADFVTAMMAFFLLMWLLNATSEEQKRGLSNYFGPLGQALGAGGTGGMLGGQSVQTPDGNFTDRQASSPMSTEMVESKASASDVDVEEEDDGMEAGKGEEDFDSKKIEEAIENFEEQMFREVEEKLKEAIEEIPEIKELAKNLIIDETPEGLRIQIVDKNKLSMFPSGSKKMYPHTRKLLEQVSKIVKKMPNQISIAGHTDSRPYSNQENYSNWELSTDRANACRRALIDFELPKDRILYVVGKAAKEPLITENPADDQNRRISIVLHRTKKKKAGPGIKPKSQAQKKGQKEPSAQKLKEATPVSPPQGLPPLPAFPT